MLNDFEVIKCSEIEITFGLLCVLMEGHRYLWVSNAG